MILRTLLPAFLAASLATTAFAQPTLRPTVSINSDLVTLGDMFEDAGALAARPVFRAPAVGTTGTVPVQDIAAAANRAGLDAFDTADLAAVTVTRPATEVGSEALIELMTADLTARGIVTSGVTPSFQFEGGYQPQLADAVNEPAQLLSLRYRPADGSFAARFTLSGHAEPLDVSGTLDMMVEVPHLAATLPAGSVLTEGDIEMRSVALSRLGTDAVALPADLVGKALKSRSSAGMRLDIADVGTPLLISRNEPVTVYLRRGPMTLTVKGQALSGAALGESMQVLNLVSNTVIHATAIAPGAVEVDTDPVAIAGL
ncbi:hypothetical protein GCM10007989_06700 [Devosia pacifica]|uniref:Flagella basal body P-ring formation protein FlgA SAF domain-containing protein n=1 Tax=Devosia pacifica TaxID=1335967 RepID=A0A918VN86_9HYPH|nr:flagellar basal body P-ring formation chaperone FlgA [Devosia pacifica]GHA14665.1 hypothetical protein GCM10007989_06700 [Devosia pacifica]